MVLLRGGLYFLDAPISLTVSGASTTSPIVYAAYPGETPIITGAKSLGGWIDASGDCAGVVKSNCYKTTIPAGFYNFEYLIYVPEGWPPSHVPYVMTRRSQSVNTPSGYTLDEGAVAFDGSNCTQYNDGTNCLDRVKIASGSVKTLSYNLNDARFYNFANWNVDALRISNYGPTRLQFTGPSLEAAGFTHGRRFLIMNSREYFQDNLTPGTFYLDCGSGTPCAQNDAPQLPGSATLYYIARPGEDPPTDTILVPQQPQLLLDGPTNVANYLTFQGLVFVGDNFVTPWAGYQSDEGQPNAKAALSFVNTTGVTIDSSIIAHTSGWGLEFTNPDCDTVGCVADPSMDNKLTNSALYDIGTSALRLGRMPPHKTNDDGNTSDVATHNTTVENNLFMATGRMYPGGAAGCIWIGSSWGNNIQYNECGDSYGGGIAIGPKSGFTYHFAYDNIVQSNRFHDLGEGVITDFGCVHIANLGGVNATGGTKGNTFQNNICHDMTDAVADMGQGAVGIYIDGRSQCNTVKYNLIYRELSAGMRNSVGVFPARGPVTHGQEPAIICPHQPVCLANSAKG